MILMFWKEEFIYLGGFLGVRGKGKGSVKSLGLGYFLDLWGVNKV